MFYRIIILAALLIGANVSVLAGDNVPAWLTNAASVKNPAYDQKTDAVVLLKENSTVVDSDGKVTTTTTHAVRILQREGRDRAVALADYLTDSSKVTEIKAWLIRPNGTTKSYGKDSVIDRISDTNDIYNESRLKIIDASDDADINAVFGFQAVVEEPKPLLYEDIWLFQTNLPVINSRYVLTLPNNWKASSKIFNYAKIEPSVNGTVYTWQVNNLQPIVYETLSPSFSNLAPRIAVNYWAGDNAQTYGTFKDWAEVSRWDSSLSDGSLIVDDTIATKARELTANAGTEIEKIRAVGHFVQNLQYISIDIGVGKGNGIRPRPSTLVLQRGYGDCKDKANLMRALLKALKIESYLVSIYSGDPTFVRADWTSPRQFNHCILAIKISEETNVTSVVKHSKFGRLLIFDATDAYTLVGDLPEHEQGSFALITAGGDGELIQMPLLAPESSKLDRTIEADLLTDGSISGTVQEKSIGQAAAQERTYKRRISATDYDKFVQNRISRGMAGAQVSKINAVDKPLEGGFSLNANFAAGSYAQVMQNRLMVFKPSLIGRLERFALDGENKRVHPVLLDSNAYSETVKVKLPAGFVVDEMPEGTNLQTAFGKYTVSYEIKENFLLMNRSLTLNRATVAADKYDSVLKFFGMVRAAEQNPVVLIKK